MIEPTDRRKQLADAAIETLAHAGMRGFTHRAVDHAAGLPEGSCSNHFRTRQALLAAAVNRLTELSVAQAFVPRPDADIDEIAADLAVLAESWLTIGRTRTLARYELSLESLRQPQLRETLLQATAGARALVEPLFITLGAADPAVATHDFAACLDGILFGHLVGTAALDPLPDRLSPVIRNLLRAFLA
ncbi:TetR/AcrR family transcriptional regulator [Nocardia sp. NPDC127579]|uniref:TetR/AcrR family transcriptional regulator n=1 Tax=Nocardia sp. NPDC127579 TaxID=3345402 RepID=UPI00362E3FE5